MKFTELLKIASLPFLASWMILLPGVSLAEGTASLSISSASQTYNVGQTFQATVSVKAGGKTFDSVRLQMSYPPNMLEVEGFSFGKSFKFTSPDNGFDNASGQLSYGGGIPGGTSQDENFGTIFFKVKKEGQANVAIKPASLVLSAGENISLGQPAEASYLLSAAPVQKKQAPANKTPAKDNSQFTDQLADATAQDLAAALPIKTIGGQADSPDKPANFWQSQYGKLLMYSSAVALALLALAETLFLLAKKKTKKGLIRIKRQR